MQQKANGTLNGVYIYRVGAGDIADELPKVAVGVSADLELEVYYLLPPHITAKVDVVDHLNT